MNERITKDVQSAGIPKEHGAASREASKRRIVSDVRLATFRFETAAEIASMPNLP